jgi:hypothetical protein
VFLCRQLPGGASWLEPVLGQEMIQKLLPDEWDRGDQIAAQWHQIIPALLRDGC